MSDYGTPFVSQNAGREQTQDYDFTESEREAELKFNDGYDPLNKHFYQCSKVWANGCESTVPYVHEDGCKREGV